MATDIIYGSHCLTSYACYDGIFKRTDGNRSTLETGTAQLCIVKKIEEETGLMTRIVNQISCFLGCHRLAQNEYRCSYALLKKYKMLICSANPHVLLAQGNIMTTVEYRQSRHWQPHEIQKTNEIKRCMHRL